MLCFCFCFFQIFEIGNIFENLDQKSQKIIFLSFLARFLSTFKNLKKKKKKLKNKTKQNKRSQRSVLTWFSKKVSIFNSKLFFFRLSQFVFNKKGFLPFSQKITIFGKIWYQKRILWLISIPEIYTFVYIGVMIKKLQLVIFFTISGFTLTFLRYLFLLKIFWLIWNAWVNILTDLNFCSQISIFSRLNSIFGYNLPFLLVIELHN